MTKELNNNHIDYRLFIFLWKKSRVLYLVHLPFTIITAYFLLHKQMRPHITITLLYLLMNKLWTLPISKRSNPKLRNRSRSIHLSIMCKLPSLSKDPMLPVSKKPSALNRSCMPTPGLKSNGSRFNVLLCSKKLQYVWQQPMGTGEIRANKNI